MDGIKSTTAAGGRRFYSLRQIFKSRAMSKAVKIKIYIKDGKTSCSVWK